MVEHWKRFPREEWSHHPWKCLKNRQKWHLWGWFGECGGTGWKVGFDHLEVLFESSWFYNLEAPTSPLTTLMCLQEINITIVFPPYLIRAFIMLLLLVFFFNVI